MMYTDQNFVISHYFNSISYLMKTISAKMPTAADGFEEFKVRGSALRHIGESLAAVQGNFLLIASLVKGCGFQLKHFALSLKADQHHMVPACGAHNPRSPLAESGYLWEGISTLFLLIANSYKNTDLHKGMEGLSYDIKNFSKTLGEYRIAMEESEFLRAANILTEASVNLNKVGSSFSRTAKYFGLNSRPLTNDQS